MPTTGGAAAPRLVFLLGSGRCGSSLLQERLGRHRGAGFMSTLDDRGLLAGRGRLTSALYRRVPQERTRKGAVRFAPSEGYRALAREVSPLVARPGRPLVAADATPWLAARFARFFVDRAARQAAPVFVHKFTGWPRAGFIDAVLPEARFVHVVRDGRAVASSLVQMPWWRDAEDPRTLSALGADADAWRAAGSPFPLLAGLVWKHVVQAHEAARADLAPGRWLDVRYEDLLADPRGQLGRLLDHLGLPLDDDFARQLARQRLSPARASAYRTDLAPRDLAQLDEHLGPTLRRLGYDAP